MLEKLDNSKSEKKLSEPIKTEKRAEKDESINPDNTITNSSKLKLVGQKKNKLKANYFDNDVNLITRTTDKLEINYDGHKFSFEEEDVDFNEPNTNRKEIKAGGFGKIYLLSKRCFCCNSENSVRSKFILRYLTGTFDSRK